MHVSSKAIPSIVNLAQPEVFCHEYEVEFWCLKIWSTVEKLVAAKSKMEETHRCGLQSRTGSQARKLDLGVPRPTGTYSPQACMACRAYGPQADATQHVWMHEPSCSPGERVRCSLHVNMHDRTNTVACGHDLMAEMDFLRFNWSLDSIWTHFGPFKRGRVEKSRHQQVAARESP